jgi:aspartate racemase
MSTSKRCLGLIGGLGPPATVHYYKALVDAFAVRKVTPRLLISHADASFVLDCVRRNDLDALAAYLADHIARMAKAGADIAVIPAVTPHICAPTLTRLSPLPLVDMIETTHTELRARKLKRISLMGTRFVMESGLFGRLDGIEIVPPAPADLEFIHDTYMGIIANNRIAPDDVERLRKIARGLVERDKVQTVVIAGTDLALAFDETTAGFPALDCARVHLDAIVAAMLN